MSCDKVVRGLLVYSASALDKGDNLCSGAVGVGADGGRGCALGDALLHSPQDGVGIVGVRPDVPKRVGRAGCRGVPATPEEGHDMRNIARPNRICGRPWRLRPTSNIC